MPVFQVLQPDAIFRYLFEESFALMILVPKMIELKVELLGTLKIDGHEGLK